VASRQSLREAQEAEVEAAKGEARARRRRPITAVVVTVLVIAIAGVGFVVGKPLYELVTKPKQSAVTDFPGPGEGQATITIEQGDPGSAIGEKLVAAGVIASAGAFIEAWNTVGSRASSIQPGTYLLKKKMSAAQALGALLDPANRNAIIFTVPEGKRADEVYQIIGLAMAQSELDTGSDQAAIDQRAAEDAAVVKGAAVPAAIGLPPEANGLVEGWLFPETYSFNIGTEPAAILSEMVANTVKVLEEIKVPRDQWLRIMTVAGMVEKEAKLEPDRPKVAQVIYNRLAQGRKLELDSTVVYGVNRHDGKLATSNAERADPNPYNTYSVPGLPAGAICNPGRAAIEAAMNPTPGTWMFFCVTEPDSGKVEFNDTAEGHAQCVKKWLAWEAEHGG
jgi:UPF0755 protein